MNFSILSAAPKPFCIVKTIALLKSKLASFEATDPTASPFVAII
jgi:hypothetical protein